MLCRRYADDKTTFRPAGLDRPVPPPGDYLRVYRRIQGLTGPASEGSANSATRQSVASYLVTACFEVAGIPPVLVSWSLVRYILLHRWRTEAAVTGGSLRSLAIAVR